MRKLVSNITFWALIVMTAIIYSCSEKQKIEKTAIAADAFKIVTPIDQVVTKNGIKIKFQSYNNDDFELLEFVVSGTYGTTVLKPQLHQDQLAIHIPEVISQHSGIIEWKLIAGETTLERGSFKLLPNIKQLKTVENYVGPRSIIANERDYTMLVSIPVDSLDNMLPDQTVVQMSKQFKGDITTTTKKIQSGFAWQRIPAPLTTGRLITGSTLQQISSKELVVDIFPDIAVPFKITKSSNHNYADGNEIIILQTDQIKDSHGNIMTDGTLVTFFIKDDHDNSWQTTASTVNGYAFAKALHPQAPSTWTVKGVINGMVESPELNITFKSIIDEIPFSFSENKIVTIGPLTSYLGQLVPDGIPVQLKIDGSEIILKTHNGISTYTFDTKIIEPNTYDIQIKTLGITTTKSIELK
ncbi:hypothetical protein [Nonlabens dokdonensis]|nr:hypothetical protein [Nonlabens dokdonensis]